MGFELSTVVKNVAPGAIRHGLEFIKTLKDGIKIDNSKNFTNVPMVIASTTVSIATIVASSIAMKQNKEICEKTMQDNKEMCEKTMQGNKEMYEKAMQDNKKMYEKANNIINN